MSRPGEARPQGLALTPAEGRGAPAPPARPGGHERVSPPVSPRPAGAFVATDSRGLDIIRAGHVDDVFVPVDPDTLPGRLEDAGFTDVGLEVRDYQIRFIATKRARADLG